jgi:hypothetical protein
MTTVWENLLPAMQAGSLAENQMEFASLKKDLNSLVLPFEKSAATSSQSSKYNGKKFKLATNEYGADEIQFRFSKDRCIMTTKTAKGETNIQFGWENWMTNKETISYPYPVAGRINVPSKIAGTAAWMNDNTLQLNARFVEAIHGDKITCTFDGNKLSVSFLNSVSENTKNNHEKRMNLSGTVS